MSTRDAARKSDTDKNREELLLELESLRAHEGRKAASINFSEEMFRALADTSMAGIMVYQGEDTLYVNQALADIEGYPLEERRRMKFWETVHPDFRDAMKVRGRARQSGEAVPSRNEIKLIRKPGTEGWVITDEQRDEILAKMAAYRKSQPGVYIGFPGDEKAFGGCLSSGRGFIYVSASGDLEPCPFAPYSDRSVIDTPLKDALNSPLFRALQANRDKLMESNGGCALWKKPEWVKSLMGS